MQEPDPVDKLPSEAGGDSPSTSGRRQRKVRFAGRVAFGNVFGLVLCAVLSIALELPSVSVIGLALVVLAWNEWRGRKLLLAADPRAPRRLAQSQLFLFLVVLVYCAHGAYVTWTGPSPLDAVLRAQPELGEALGAADPGASLEELTEWARSVALVVYGAVAVGSLIVQGLTGLFYLSLRPTVAALGEP